MEDAAFCPMEFSRVVHTFKCRNEMRSKESNMRITSPAFAEGEMIPEKYSRDDADLSPPLYIEGVPREAKSLALIVDDPDSPSGNYTHWLLFNMSPSTKEIHEGSAPVMATQGRNNYNEVSYGGPQPPSGEHRYYFKLYALDTVLGLPRGASRAELEEAMRGHILDEAKTMGRFAAAVPAGG
jgi:Raf kinase inhibitor-like YbhB/YbcL family protein